VNSLSHRLQDSGLSENALASLNEVSPLSKGNPVPAKVRSITVKSKLYLTAMHMLALWRTCQMLSLTKPTGRRIAVPPCNATVYEIYILKWDHNF